MDSAGRRLAKARLPEGVAGIARLHAMIGEQLGEDADEDDADTLELLARAPDPAAAAKLTTAQISAALKRARRRDIAAKAERIQAVLRAAHLGQPDIVAAAYAASVRALIAVLATLNEQ